MPSAGPRAPASRRRPGSASTSTDMDEFPKLNDVYATFFEKPFPVRTTVGVAALPKGALVEMDATVPLPSNG